MFPSLNPEYGRVPGRKVHYLKSQNSQISTIFFWTTNIHPKVLQQCRIAQNDRADELYRSVHPHHYPGTPTMPRSAVDIGRFRPQIEQRLLVEHRTQKDVVSWLESQGVSLTVRQLKQ
jgi:hypothetical protein